MSIKKLTLTSLGFFSLSLVTGCASSSFHEYFNEPVPVIEHSVSQENVQQIKEDKLSPKVENDNSVETSPIELNQ